MKDQKDEIIVMLKRKATEYEEQIKKISKELEEHKKGEGGAETKIKALNEMHSQKVKALLKSIQILKKEVQKEQYFKKDNVRAQQIERMKKDMTDYEVTINALRKLVG